MARCQVLGEHAFAEGGVGELLGNQLEAVHVFLRHRGQPNERKRPHRCSGARHGALNSPVRRWWRVALATCARAPAAAVGRAVSQLQKAGNCWHRQATGARKRAAHRGAGRQCRAVLVSAAERVGAGRARLDKQTTSLQAVIGAHPRTMEPLLPDAPRGKLAGTRLGGDVHHPQCRSICSSSCHATAPRVSRFAVAPSTALTARHASPSWRFGAP